MSASHNGSRRVGLAPCLPRIRVIVRRAGGHVNPAAGTTRHHVASSFLSVAIGEAFGTAMAGRSWSAPRSPGEATMPDRVGG
jgi:hypothetical protein